jgi:hypothetical protein
MVLSVATKVFMPEIELANRIGPLAGVARRHLIDLSPQAWKESCRMRETTASRGALGTFRTAAGKCCLDMLGVFATWRASVAEGGARRPARWWYLDGRTLSARAFLRFRMCRERERRGRDNMRVRMPSAPGADVSASVRAYRYAPILQGDRKNANIRAVRKSSENDK